MSRSPPAAAETNIRVRALESEHKSRLSALLVIPAKAGIQGCSVAPVALGPRFREGDENSQRLGHAVRTTDIITVAGEDSSLRLDCWFKRHYPALGHGRLENCCAPGGYGSTSK